MALLDFLKKKKENEKASASAKASADRKKPEKKAGEVKLEKKAEKVLVAPAKAIKTAGKFSFESVRQPHISEKGTNLGEINQYIFKVSPNFNKKEIKKTVEGIYGVDVLSVNTIKIPAKKRRLGKTEGFRKQYKKAVIKIKEGQKIEIL